MKIALCDDNKEILARFQDTLQKIAKEEGMDLVIHTFSSGENLLFELDEQVNAYDILYLDIEMGKMNGIETARILRDKGCQAILIFLTNNDQYVFQSFDVLPLHYILKTQITYTKFRDIFLRAVAHKEKKDSDVFICEFQDEKKLIPLHEITYFDVVNRIVTVHYKTEEFHFYAKLETICEGLHNKWFVRIHRSFAVNLSYIDHISSKYVFLNTGVELPIGSTYHKALKEQFCNYLLEMV